MTILAVMGLTREEKIVGHADIRTIAGGGLSGRLAEKIAEQIAAKRPKGVISIGIAGALDPSLKVGDVLVAREIVAEGERFETHEGWSAALLKAMPGAHHAGFYGSEVIVMEGAEKRRLREATGAMAVDMESHVAARVAAAHGLPFAAVRVVSDTTHADLPPAFLNCMKPDGGINYAAITRSILGDPRQLPALMRTAREVEAAFASLVRRRGDLGPRLLGLVDVGEHPLDVA